MSRRVGTPEGLLAPGRVVFIGPLHIPYCLFTEKGVFWSYRFSGCAGAVLGSAHVGDSVRVHCHETRNRCRYALVDSRGSRTLVHDLGALQMVGGRAAPGSSPEPIIWRFRLTASQLVTRAAEAGPTADFPAGIGRPPLQPVSHPSKPKTSLPPRFATPVGRAALQVYFAGAGAGVSSSSPESSTSTAEPGTKS